MSMLLNFNTSTLVAGSPTSPAAATTAAPSAAEARESSSRSTPSSAADAATGPPPPSSAPLCAADSAAPSSSTPSGSPRLPRPSGASRRPGTTPRSACRSSKRFCAERRKGVVGRGSGARERVLIAEVPRTGKRQLHLRMLLRLLGEGEEREQE